MKNQHHQRVNELVLQVIHYYIYYKCINIIYKGEIRSVFDLITPHDKERLEKIKR